jgi:hypothetical protein
MLNTKELRVERRYQYHTSEAVGEEIDNKTVALTKCFVERGLSFYSDIGAELALYGYCTLGEKDGKLFIFDPEMFQRMMHGESVEKAVEEKECQHRFAVIGSRSVVKCTKCQIEYEAVI